MSLLIRCGGFTRAPVPSLQQASSLSTRLTEEGKYAPPTLLCTVERVCCQQYCKPVCCLLRIIIIAEYPTLCTVAVMQRCDVTVAQNTVCTLTKCNLQSHFIV